MPAFVAELTYSIRVCFEGDPRRDDVVTRLNARAIMSPTVVTVGDRMTTHEVAQFLVEHEISGAPVVDELGRLVGVISITDIARVAAEPVEALGGQAPSDFYGADDDERRAGWNSRFIICA